MSNKVNLETSEDSEDDISDASIYNVNSGKKQFFSNVTVSNGKVKVVAIKFQLDTGASCSTLTHADYKMKTNVQHQQPQENSP